MQWVYYWSMILRRLSLIVLLCVVALGGLQTASVLRLWMHSQCSLAQTWAGTRRDAAIQRRATALMRQVHSLGFDGGLEHVSIAGGDWWIPRGTQQTGSLAFELAEQETGIYRKVRPGDVVLDVGASLGTFTRRALAAGARHVVAIEPVPELIECLRRNLSTEIAGGRVSIMTKGAWDRDDWLMMHHHADNGGLGSFILRTPGSAIDELRLPLTTIDKIAAELKLDRVDFIKMDIEGAERHALLGARETIRRYHPRMEICVYHLVDDLQVIPALFPAYRSQCDRCTAETPSGEVRFDVAHFE